jgi:hypothetical protein
MWVVDWVHCDTANGRSDTPPTLRTGLTQGAQAVLAVADFAKRGAAFAQYATHFARAHTQGSVAAFSRDQLARTARTANHLRAFTGLQLDAVDNAAHWNIADGQGITGFNR